MAGGVVEGAVGAGVGYTAGGGGWCGLGLIGVEGLAGVGEDGGLGFAGGFCPVFG